MTGPVVTGKRLSDGREITLQSLSAMELLASVHSPAVSFRGCFAAEGFFPRMGEMAVEWGGRERWRGSLDQQVEVMSERGRRVEVEARSKGGLLLDNEAEPCTLYNPNLATVFSLFVKPYGFALYNPDPAGGIALYTVHKGNSEWDALVGFTRRVYGRTPYVEGDVVMVRPAAPEKTLVFGNGGGGIAYTCLEHRFCPYRVLSKVVLRDGDGYYTSAVHNSSAGYYGVRRKRYIIPQSEFSDHPGLDANARLRRSLLEMERVVLTLPGLVEVKLGQRAAVRDRELGLENQMVEEAVWKLDGDGATTRVTLCSRVYYD